MEILRVSEDVPLAVGFRWGLHDGLYDQLPTAAGRSSKPGLFGDSMLECQGELWQLLVALHAAEPCLASHPSHGQAISKICHCAARRTSRRCVSG